MDRVDRGEVNQFAARVHKVQVQHFLTCHAVECNGGRAACTARTHVADHLKNRPSR
jgi:hypothetical protein